MTHKRGKIPARDRAKAYDLAYHAGFRLVDGVSSSAQSHVWRAVDLRTKREMILKIERVRNTSFDETVPPAFWKSTFPGVPRTFDRHSSPRFGTALLLESIAARSVAEVVESRENLIRSSHAGLLLTDLVRMARTSLLQNVCLGAAPLDNLAISYAGNLTLFGQRSVHLSGSALGNDCCRLGVEPQLLIDLLRMTMPEGFRRTELARAVMQELRDKTVAPERLHDALLIVIASFVSNAPRTSLAHLMRGSNLDVLDEQDTPSLSQRLLRFVHLARIVTRRAAPQNPVCDGKERSRQYGRFKKPIFVGAALALGVLTTAVFALPDSEDAPAAQSGAHERGERKKAPVTENSPSLPNPGVDVAGSEASEESNNAQSSDGNNAEAANTEMRASHSEGKTSEDPVEGTRWILGEMRQCALSGEPPAGQSRHEHFLICAEAFLLDPVASIEKELADFVLGNEALSSPSEIELVDFLGGTALTTAVWRGADGGSTTTASLLMVRSEAGWRLRAFY
ncbi:hypothetical protein [Lysinibacter sp. HNR]|uniref:hypothetical protein n=1 Tax=Lysinibacter sp. HNR TaxID=3031408 RepID=UPI002435C85A|nr:hypothetical protein [Lysinibacter sp. HNR]WGD36168.1 hypothetical protein FrondiHNR_06625 [Lysinibacter sp. HNR]